MSYALATVALVLCALSAYGWGLAGSRVTGSASTPWPAVCSLGIALLLFLGGLANLAHIAYAPLLWALFATGVALSLGPLLGALRAARAWRPGLDACLAGAFVALCACWVVGTQMPTRLFNYHDDFEKYLAHPVRMLATGALYGSPLSALGSETLGGSAFLQGFALSIGGPGYIGDPDAAFGLLLLLCLAAAAGHRKLGAFPGALAAALLAAFIEPSIVNVSPVYLGAALIASTITLPSATPRALGLLYGGLIVLKPTFALYCALHLPALAFLGAHAGQRARFVLRTLGWTMAATAPWLLLHAPHYLHVAAGQADLVVPRVNEVLLLFSSTPLSFGPSSLHYVVLAILLLCAAALCAGSAQEEPRRILAGSTAAFGAWLATAVLLAPYMSGYQTGLRLATAFLLGSTPVVLALAGGIPGPGAMARRAVAIAGLLVGIAMFAAPAAERAQRAWRYGAVLAYLSRVTPAQAHTPYVLHGMTDEARKEVRRIQDFVPAGEPAVVWTSQSFHLDFARNRILDVDPAGLTTYWAELPGDVDYVMWEYEGEVVRGANDYLAGAAHPGSRDGLMNMRGLEFARRLIMEMGTGTVVYQDAHYVVFKRAR